MLVFEPCTSVYAPEGGDGMEQLAVTVCMQSLLQSVPRSTTAWLVTTISVSETRAPQLLVFVVAQLAEKHWSNVTLTLSVVPSVVKQTKPSLSKTTFAVSSHPDISPTNRQ
jgi:hypothetical protein